NTDEAFRVAYDASNYIKWVPNATGGAVVTSVGTAPFLTFSSPSVHFPVNTFDITMSAGNIGPVINAGDATNSTLTLQNSSSITAIRFYGDGHATFNSYITTTTQSPGDNSTKAATTAYSDMIRLDNQLSKSANYTVLTTD